MYKTLLSSTLPLAAGALMAASATLQAEPAVYRDGSMKVPQAAVIRSNENSYYTDVTLGFGSDGTLQVTGATLNYLVGVDTVEAQVTQTLATQEVSLAVSGNLSVPCWTPRCRSGMTLLPWSWPNQTWDRLRAASRCWSLLIPVLNWM